MTTIMAKPVSALHPVAAESTAIPSTATTTTEGGDDSVPGRVQISLNRPQFFYERVVRRYLAGYRGRAAVDVITLTALGSAITKAIAIRDSLESNKVAVMTKLETSYTINETTRIAKRLPRITIEMKRHPDYVPVPEQEPSPTN